MSTKQQRITVCREFGEIEPFGDSAPELDRKIGQAFQVLDEVTFGPVADLLEAIENGWESAAYSMVDRLIAMQRAPVAA